MRLHCKMPEEIAPGGMGRDLRKLKRARFVAERRSKLLEMKTITERDLFDTGCTAQRDTVTHTGTKSNLFKRRHKISSPVQKTKVAPDQTDSSHFGNENMVFFCERGSTHFRSRN